MQYNPARRIQIMSESHVEGDTDTINSVNEVLQQELVKQSDFRRDRDKETARNGRVWKVLFPTNGKGSVVQYFNDDVPRDYKLDLPISVTKQLVEVVKSRERVPAGDQIFDLTMYYDKPLVSVALLKPRKAITS